MTIIANVDFEDKELNAIHLAKYYQKIGAPGLPNHLYLVLIAKLASIVEKQNTFSTDKWQSD